MFDFIPLGLYYPIYINLSLALVLFTVLHAYVLPIDDTKNISYINWAGYTFLIFSILYIGTRPVSGRYFGDMVTYNRYFTYYANGGDVQVSKDMLFHYFMKICSQVLSNHTFFTLCEFIYIYPLYKVSKTFFKDYWFYAFLMFAVSFSFWSYGTNGIRNGIATSLFLLGISYYNKRILMIFWLFIASQVHQTLLLPIGAFILTFFYKNSKAYLVFWISCIPLSIALGGFWESLFASLGFADERLGAYLVGGVNEEDSFSSTGFRYDFLVYSAGAVAVGWYFIFRKKFKDLVYIHLYNTYLISNAFWILVIRANFSNRFAYLSWFMMGLVIIYPYITQKFFVKHHVIVGKVLTVYFLFTYLMFYIYYDGE